LADIVKGNFPGGLQVIEVRPHAAADMDIPPTSMVNTRRIQVRLDVYSTGPLASFMMKHGLVAGVDGARFVSEQGTKMGRRSILHVQIHSEQGADKIDVGGYVTPVSEATMKL
jgi:hypothetical protein